MEPERKGIMKINFRIGCSLCALGAMLVAGAGCSQENKDRAKQNADTAIDKTSDGLNKLDEQAKEAGAKLKVEAQKAQEKITNATAKAWDSAKTEAQKANDQIKAKTSTNSDKP